MNVWRATRASLRAGAVARPPVVSPVVRVNPPDRAHNGHGLEMQPR